MGYTIWAPGKNGRPGECVQIESTPEQPVLGNSLGALVFRRKRDAIGECLAYDQPDWQVIRDACGPSEAVVYTHKPSAQLVEVKKPKPGTMVCLKCGSANVQVAMWVRPNTGEVIDCLGSSDETDTTFCEDCDDHTGVRYVEKE